MVSSGFGLIGELGGCLATVPSSRKISSSTFSIVISNNLRRAAGLLSEFSVVALIEKILHCRVECARDESRNEI